VNALIHQFDDPGGLVEVVTLRRSQRVLLEERDNDVPQILEPTDIEPEEILPVVVMSPVDVDLAAPEVFGEVVKYVPTRRSLHNRETWLYLPTERRLGVPENGAAETAFPIHETNDPSVIREHFLLIFRTSSIVTWVHNVTVQTSCDTDTDPSS
jgi:hypothetical protein